MLPIFDSYTFKARLLPVTLTILPITIIIFLIFPETYAKLSIMIGTFSLFGLTWLFSQLGRDFGKKKEYILFNQWGGAPTTLMLRHRDSKFTKISLLRYHKKLATLINIEMPAPETELSDPVVADEIYKSCIDYLKERTREHKLFPLVFAENINYGFRRNLWGIKPLAITVGIVCLIIVLFFLWLGSITVSVLSLSSIFILLLLQIIWISCIRPDWIKIAAFAYAERLISSCEIL